MCGVVKKEKKEKKNNPAMGSEALVQLWTSLLLLGKRDLSGTNVLQTVGRVFVLFCNVGNQIQGFMHARQVLYH